MNTLLKSLLIVTVLGISSAYLLDDEYNDNLLKDNSEEADNSDLLQVFRRTAASKSMTRKLCIPWRSPCTLDDALIAKYSFLRCCSGGCKCNLWGNNCKCEATLGR